LLALAVAIGEPGEGHWAVLVDDHSEHRRHRGAGPRGRSFRPNTLGMRIMASRRRRDAVLHLAFRGGQAARAGAVALALRALAAALEVAAAEPLRDLGLEQLLDQLAKAELRERWPLAMCLERVHQLLDPLARLRRRGYSRSYGDAPHRRSANRRSSLVQFTNEVLSPSI
jgi:hypothetical protein